MAPRPVVRVASSDLLPSFMALTATHYSDEPVNDPEVIEWRHLESPAGPSTAVELVDGEQTVGRMWIHFQTWTVNGAKVTAANPIDFLIREDHRNIPTFMSLFRTTMREADSRADMVFHTSNPVTDELYRGLMKLKPVTELDGAVLPVRPFAAARAGKVVDARVIGKMIDALVLLGIRVLGWASRIAGVSLLDEASLSDQEAVLAAFRDEEAACGERSAEYRAWRFRGAGPIRYHEQWVARRGRVIGYVVTSDRDIDDVAGRFVIDVVMAEPQPRFARWSLWLQLASSAARDRRQAIFFFYNRSNPRLANLASLPLITVARDRLPQRVPVFVRLRMDEGRPTNAHEILSSGYFVLADFDLL